MNKLFKILLITILLLSATPPISVLAAQDIEVSVVRTGDTFLLYEKKDPITIKSGEFASKGFNRSVNEYKTEDILTVIGHMQGYPDSIKYGSAKNKWLSSSNDPFAEIFKEQHGKDVKGYTNEKEVLLDVFTYEIVKRVNLINDNDELRKMKNQLKVINYDRTISKAMQEALDGLGVQDGLKGFQKSIEDKIGELNAKAAAGTASEYIEVEYINKTDSSSIKIDQWYFAHRLAVIMTWDKAPGYTVYDEIIDTLKLTGKSQEEYATDLWKKINASSMEDYEKASIYNVFKMRTSITKDIDLDEPTLDGQEPNLQAEDHVKQVYEEFQEYINDTYPDATAALKSRYTFDLRLRYHYYASQMSGDAEGIPIVNPFTQDSGSDAHYFAVDIPNFSENVTHPEQYSMFNNVIQELPFAREFILNGVLKDITDDNKGSTEVLEAVGYLRALKAGVVFLEGIGDPSLEGAIKYWYEGTPSMETIYQTVLSMGLIEDLDNSSTPINDERPLSKYFSVEDAKLSLHLRIGIAQSARYIPLKTNVYEPSTYNGIDNDTFFDEFHYIWGYNRKALYIDTSARAAVNTYNTGKVGGLKVATLKDIIDNGNDIVLYSDTEFYNTNKLLSIEEKAHKAKEDAIQAANNAQAEIESKWGTAQVILSFDLERIVKYKVSTVWDEFSGKVTEYALATRDFIMKSVNPEDELFLAKEDIEENLNKEEYSVMKPFAVTSAIYRDKPTKEFLEKAGVEPVFVASKSLDKITGTEYKDKSSSVNYALVENIRSNKLIDYKSSLDYNSPVYLDIYGNIITSTGYVVIPAASNATMYKQYNPYNAGFISTYGKEMYLDKEYTFPDIYDGSTRDYESKVFEVDEELQSWVFKPISIDSLVDLNQLSTSDEDTLKTLYALTRKSIDGTDWDNERFISNVLIEVMRGAPLEDIDLEAEGIKPDNKISQSGILQAYKLDQLKDTLSTKSQNALLSLPNPAFMPGVEYIVYFGYKIGIVIMLIMIFIQIFIMTMRNAFSMVSILKIIGSVALTIVALFLIPWIMNVTYYESNKLLLQDETVKISMLNLEKEEAGVEIGVTDIQPTEIDTELLIRLAKLDMPWSDIIEDVIKFDDDILNMEDLYDRYASSELVSLEEDVKKINSGLYIDVKDIYSSSYVVFEPTFKNLYQQTSGTTPISFYMPYYVILDSLIMGVNEYNMTNGTFSYTTNTFEGGKIKSIGLIDDFLLSDTFMKNEENVDFLFLRQLYGEDYDVDDFNPFSEEDIEAMQKSLWYNDNITPEELYGNIEELNRKARSFIINNRELLGRLSDETFIKVMSMHLALEYNKLFNVGTANSLEIFNLSPDDLVRLSVAPSLQVMEGSTFSYSRFIYEVSGQVGVYLAAILEVILFVSGYVKPIVTLLMFGVLFVNVFLYKLVFRMETETTKGTLYTVFYMCLLNLLYSVILKVSLLLPSMGIPSGVSMMAQIALHTVFLAGYVVVITMVISDFANYGATNFNAMHMKIKELTIDKLGKGSRDSKSYDRGGDAEDVWEYYDDMHKRDKQKQYDIEYPSNFTSKTADRLNREYRESQQESKEDKEYKKETSRKYIASTAALMNKSPNETNEEYEKRIEAFREVERNPENFTLDEIKERGGYIVELTGQDGERTTYDSDFKTTSVRETTDPSGNRTTKINQETIYPFKEVNEPAQHKPVTRGYEEATYPSKEEVERVREERSSRKNKNREEEVADVYDRLNDDNTQKNIDNLLNRK